MLLNEILLLINIMLVSIRHAWHHICCNTIHFTHSSLSLLRQCQWCALQISVPIDDILYKDPWINEWRLLRFKFLHYICNYNQQLSMTSDNLFIQVQLNGICSGGISQTSFEELNSWLYKERPHIYPGYLTCMQIF